MPSDLCARKEPVIPQITGGPLRPVSRAIPGRCPAVSPSGRQTHQRDEGVYACVWGGGGVLPRTKNRLSPRSRRQGRQQTARAPARLRGQAHLPSGSTRWGARKGGARPRRAARVTGCCEAGGLRLRIAREGRLAERNWAGSLACAGGGHHPPIDGRRRDHR